jgi:hypothetical protein
VWNAYEALTFPFPSICFTTLSHNPTSTPSAKKKENSCCQRFYKKITPEYYEIKITSKSFAQKFELKWTLGGPLSKLCVIPPFSINFRCQIENQVSNYRLLGASSLYVLIVAFIHLLCSSFLRILQLLVLVLLEYKCKQQFLLLNLEINKPIHLLLGTFNIYSGFFCEIISASLFRLGILWDKNHIKIFCSEIWVEMNFGWPTFKIMCNTPIFSSSVLVQNFIWLLYK